MKTLTDSELKALVRLLGEDEKNAALIGEHLMNAGTTALPYLDEAVESADPVVRDRARLISTRLRFEGLKQVFQSFSALADWDMDLEQGVFMIARYAYPDVDEKHYSQELNRIAGSISLALHDEMYMEDVVDVINEYLFDREGFHPDNRRFYDPENSYVNRVIERRIGIPISLSVIYLLVAQRLELPISGVAVPGHFLVRYDGPYETLWIDPFNEGALLSRDDCEELLRAMGYPVIDEYLKPCTPRQIVARMLNNLAQVFGREGESDRAEEVNALVDILLH